MHLSERIHLSTYSQIKTFSYLSPLSLLRNISANASEQDLLQVYKQTGNLEVLAKLYEPYMQIVYGVSLKYLENIEDAKDAVINIYEELISKVKKYEIDNFGGWLYQLTKNHSLMCLRSRKNHPRIVELPVMHLPSETHLESIQEKENNFDKMHACIEQLHSEQQFAVKMFYLQNKCYKEIADQTGFEVNKVRSHIQNGRRNLKLCMEAIEED